MVHRVSHGLCLQQSLLGGPRQEMFPRGGRGPVFENIVKGGFERRTDHNAWLNILKELLEYHDCLKRKEETVGIRKDSQASNRRRVKVKI